MIHNFMECLQLKICAAVFLIFLLMYENYFYKISSGTENSIYMKLYLYLHQHVFKGKLKSLKLAV